MTLFGRKTPLLVTFLDFQISWGCCLKFFIFLLINHILFRGSNDVLLVKDEITSADGVVCYGLPGATDLWQPVDAGVAKVLKTLTVVSHRDWLDLDNNAD